MRSYQCLNDERVGNGPYSIIPVQDDHIESIRMWRNAQMDVLRQSSVISSLQQQSYFETKVWTEMNTLQPSNILMAYRLNNKLIGYGGLVHISWEHLRAEVSFLAEPNRAKNAAIYASDQINFLLLMKMLAFNQLGFQRLFTETYANRLQHIDNLEAAGFIREGVMYEHVRINDRPVDSVIHGCLRIYEK
jgi:RimJ/RimL family protein N-acetyltransferase